MGTQDTTPKRFAVVGLGGMGTLIAPMALDDGHELVGGVDVGAAVGRPLSEFIEHARTPDVAVHGTIDDLVAAVGKPDVVFVAASIPLEEEAKISRGLLEQGINVLTLEATLFEGIGDIADELDAAGRAGGASILAGGIQDTWWVHLPAVAAGANSAITKVSFDDLGDITVFTRAEGEYEAGAGLPQEQWDEWAAVQLAAPPVQGGPLRELARVLGFTPGPIKHEITPIRQDTAAAWPGAETELAAGEIIGATFSVEFETEEAGGPLFTGTLRFQLTEGGVMASFNSISISGATELTMRFPGYNAYQYVPIGLVRRINDVVAAPAGLVRVRELAPAPYVKPV